MQKALFPIALGTLTLTLAGTAAAGGCGMYKGKVNYHNAVMTYGMHPMYGMPRSHPTDNYRHGGYHYGADAYTDGYDKGGYSKTGHSESAMTKKTEPNIVEVASYAGSFNTLVTAVKAAGLAETLMGDGPFTVFAPTDEAFAKLPEGTVEALLADKEKLTKVLTYHVVAGKLDASAVGGASKLATVEGSELPVADIKIAKTDVKASNGIIHVINEVLIPEA